jgi:hypothetical protein
MLSNRYTSTVSSFDGDGSLSGMEPGTQIQWVPTRRMSVEENTFFQHLTGMDNESLRDTHKDMLNYF